MTKENENIELENLKCNNSEDEEEIESLPLRYHFACEEENPSDNNSTNDDDSDDND